jgi:NADH dehydrogenase FAD-containing subunit
MSPAGNAARPLVRDLVKDLPGQAKFNNADRPAASKLGVDPFLRVVGARDMVALGDCSMMVGDRLPATAQVSQPRGRTHPLHHAAAVLGWCVLCKVAAPRSLKYIQHSDPSVASGA